MDQQTDIHQNTTEAHHRGRPRRLFESHRGSRRPRNPRFANTSRQEGTKNENTVNNEVPTRVSRNLVPVSTLGEPSNASSGPISQVNDNLSNTNRYRPNSRGNNRRGRGGHRRINFLESQNIDQNSDNQTSNTNHIAPRARVSRIRYSREGNPLQTSSAHNIIDHPESSSSEHVDTAAKNHQEKLSKDASDIQSEIAETQLKGNTFECMICCDNISRFNPIWYCSSCYNIFHLKCSIEWCNKSIKSRNEAIANAQYPSLGTTNQGQINRAFDASRNSQLEGYSDYRSERVNSVEWPCPACREVLNSKPSKYFCFCGKVVRPDVNRQLTPHSCGQLCGRARPNVNCPHTCNTICHPGRCAPCPLTSRRPCFCGKVIKEVKCYLGFISCDQVCNKPLTCGEHFCSKICHAGSCETCTETVTISCYCGSLDKKISCIELNRSSKHSKNFSCEKVCGKLLDCGKHYCNEKCHPGPDCQSCKLLSENIKTCPCGSTQIKKSVLADRRSCTDPLPTCENKCNRLLICGPDKNKHRCQKKCHIGRCPPCKLKTSHPCECKLSTKTIECSVMYEKVTDGDRVQFKQIKYSFSCETRCNKLKNCGRHRCNNKCCSPTKVLETQVHKCDQICNKKLPCGKHNCNEICHTGQCGDCPNIGWEELTCHCGLSVLYPPIPCGARPPACQRPCRRAQSCGHPIKHECHDDTEKCPPCTVFVKKSCFCGSDSKDSVYCYMPGYSCGRTCKKTLTCKQHNCRRVCHDGDCESPNERRVILCQQPCPVTRYLCKHPCNLPCHGSTPCPASECRKKLEITCECGNKKEQMECFKVMSDVENRNKMAIMISSRSNQESVMIDLTKKPAPKPAEISDGGKLKRLDCDESCSVLKRNNALAEALDIARQDLRSTNVFGEDPLRLIREATVQDYKFVASTYNSLVRFIKSAKESDKRFIFMQFPPAESQDDEPFRHVVVRAYKNKSSVPDFNIEQLLPVPD